MSSDLLLSARALRKTYMGTQSPFSTLMHALFGTRSNPADEYPVLHGIDLDVWRGETVGIMGRNGAGKTTLLGILGGVIQASGGTVEKKGRIATLLGLTAGFNLNFTGRENAHLFCSMHGLTRANATAKVAAIGQFSELGRYFDLPLRTYSSGMQSRLAFSCAAHVNADLIIIDETLAVGDSNFRLKCYERISQMKNEGQTFLLVSHNQNLIANYCTRAIVLEGGCKVFDGSTMDAVSEYKRIRAEAAGDSDLTVHAKPNKKNDSAESEVALSCLSLSESRTDGEASIAVRCLLTANADVGHLSLHYGIRNEQGIVVCAFDGEKAGVILSPMCTGDTRTVEMHFLNRLLPGKYFLAASIHELIGDVTKSRGLFQNFVSFEVTGVREMAGIANLAMSLRTVSDLPVSENSNDLYVKQH